MEKQAEEAKLKEYSDILTDFIDLYAGPSDTVYRDYGNGDLVTMTQVHLLGTIEENPGITATGLSLLKRKKKSSISQVLSQLIQKGYVERMADPHDLKKLCLYVTPRGRELCELHSKYDIASMGRTHAMLRASCTEEELDHFYKVLRSYNQIRRQQT